MKDPKRIDTILDELETYWKANPQLRLGQILVMVSMARWDDPDPFHVKDQEVLAWLEEQNDSD